MAGQGADPAALLTVYLRHDRLADAADLVLSHLAAYQKVLNALPVLVLTCYNALGDTVCPR